MQMSSTDSSSTSSSSSTGANANIDWHKCVERMVTLAMMVERDNDNETNGGGGAATQDVLDAAARMPYLTEVGEAIVSDIGTFNANRNSGGGGSNSSNNKKNNNEEGEEEEGEEEGEDDKRIVGQMILSDGNTLFISAFLEANGMDRSFDEGVMSNIGSFTSTEAEEEACGQQQQQHSDSDSGENNDGGSGESNDGSANSAKPATTLRVVHQSAKYGGHKCERCARSPNLCKTQALTDKLTNDLQEGRIS